MEYLKRTWAEIDVDALLHNFKQIKSTCGEVAAVVKADAYGHGASVVAPILQKAGADMFAVSNVDEALELRNCGIKKPILILGFTPIKYAKLLAKNDIIQTIYSFEYAGQLSAEAQSANITLTCHLKIDTGMSRLGFNCRDNNLSGVTEMLKTALLPSLNICGVFTHFATADSEKISDKLFTDGQYSRFKSACDKLEEAGVSIDVKHCCNSAGLMLNTDKHLSLCRPGIILYGLTPAADLTLPLSLIPVMTFKSTISFIKEISTEVSVSYGRNFTAKSNMRVATVSAGYADGYPRILSNRGYVLINGRKATILGNVCMDQMIVDITDIPSAAEGDEVILFGCGLPVEDIAALCNTINYELVCGVSRRVPRVYIEGGKEIKVVDYILDK